VTTAELLRKAADALDLGMIPLQNPFLSNHEVTFDQCISLAQQLATGARIVAKGIENPKSPQGIAYLLALVEQGMAGEVPS
jgi:hypothetical protein